MTLAPQGLDAEKLPYQLLPAARTLDHARPRAPSLPMKLWSHRLMHPSQWLTGHEDEVASKGAPALDEAQVRLLIQFMSEIGAAMNGAGEATTFVRRTLQRVGRAYGLQQLGVFAVPTLLLLRYGDDRSTFVDLSSRIPADLRLDQTAALYELIEEAQDARISPAEGM
ncbi:MAG TPA: threonine/serine exporter family protein, partial [Dehalococcoidia bacterium]|nr:threonine/serine exporter family protein [Dehalococcoidia bacterium]